MLCVFLSDKGGTPMASLPTSRLELVALVGNIIKAYDTVVANSNFVHNV